METEGREERKPDGTEIYAQSVLTWEAFCDFQKIHAGMGKRFGIQIVLLAVCVVLILRIFLRTFLRMRTIGSVIAYLITMAVLFPLLYFLIKRGVNRIKKREFDRLSPQSRSVQRYTFRADNFYVECPLEAAGGEGGFMIHNYSSLDHICESAKYFILYISPRQAYILQKSGLINAAPEELGALLHAKIEPKKYRINPH